MRGLRTWLIAALGALVLLAGSLSSAQAERRVALVIGNSSYRSMTALQNPRNDAADVATTLRDLGFEVMLRPDVERSAIGTVLKDFSRMVVGADVALFYYAGHALEFRGQYFLVPIDAALEDGDALKYDMISAEDVRELLGRASGVRLMIFDACRNDPLDAAGTFSPEAARAVRRDALTRALEGASGAQGMVVAYATAPFDVAEDGKARNSPFTRSLLKWMREAELEVRPMFQRISRDVYDQTRGRQVPEISVALNSPLVLNRTESHNSAWLRIRQSSDPLDFRDFLARFPYSEHAPRAARRLDVLERAQRLAEQRQREEEAQRKAEEERLRREEAERRAAAERAEQLRQAAERRRAACADERGQIDALRAAGRRSDLERLKAVSACPEESGPRVDAVLAELAEAACRQEAERVDQLAAAGRKDDLLALDTASRCAETRRLARQAVAAIERREEEERARQRAAAARREEAERQAAEQRRRDALCADEARRIRDAAGGEAARAGLDALRARLQCDENAGLLEAARAAASAREAAMKDAAAREAVARDIAAKEAAAKDAAAKEAAAKEVAAKDAAAKDAAAKASAAREATAKEATAKESAVREAAAKEAAAKESAAKEAAAKEAAAKEATAKEAAAKASAAREAAAKEAVAREAAAREMAAREAAAKESAAKEAAAKESAAKESAAKDAAAREAQAAARAACAAEASAFSVLDASDPLPLAAFARTARCPDVAAAARAQLQRLETERDKVEQACARDRGEFERLRQLGAEGRDRLERLGAATACEGLRPLVVAALGPGGVPGGEAAAPAVNAPVLIRRASRALRQIGCFDGGADDESLESVHAALKRYNTVRAVEPAALDVDEAVVKRLEGEGRQRVCPLECPAGEEARGERCVPGAAARPREREGAKPAPQAAPKPAAPKPAAPKLAAPKPAPKPAAEAAPKPAAAPRPTPPVASAPPPARRQPSIILGN